MKDILIYGPLVFIGTILVACAPSPIVQKNNLKNIPLIARLGENDSKGFDQLSSAFTSSNPGYDLEYYFSIEELAAAEEERVVFIQSGGGTATMSSGISSKFSVGDIILVKPGESIKTDSSTSVLIFTVPEKVPEGIPAFIRPDWDENITDTPGGCATETNAYRRILLTWLDQVGPYQYHALNAHRVRIMDSFTHYHPSEGGFDEFYLVQMAQSQARIITSSKVGLIENPSLVTASQASNLLDSTYLNVGDLVYLPRGTIHRGLGGVLAQVITVPGFIPGSEIGVDHHLRSINENLELSGASRIPYNQEASNQAIIK